MDSNGVPTGNMIFGAKPCNYSWWDHEGVVNRDLQSAGMGVGTQQNFNTNIPAPAGFVSRPAYVATTSYLQNNGVHTWSVNPDGMLFPNVERNGTIGGLVGPSCSAALPKIEAVSGTPNWLRLLTTNANRADYLTYVSRYIYLNEVHVKPVDPWSPNYVEDTSFLACAPLSDPYLEPPLHFYKKDSNTMAWCAEAYPTQNPYWTTLNGVKKTTSATLQGQLVNFPNTGFAAPSAGATPISNYAQVQGYTSHDVAGGDAVPNYGSAYLDVTYPGSSTLDGTIPGLGILNNCTGTLPAVICSMTSNGGTVSATANDCIRYLSHRADYTRKTCDRTVMFDSNQAFKGFPLLAPDKDIEAMLSTDLNHDKSFGCEYSVNTDQTKIGVKIPSSGCCGVVGGVSIIGTVTNGTGGHLEPYTNGAAPTVRFCGNPVQ